MPVSSSAAAATVNGVSPPPSQGEGKPSSYSYSSFLSFFRLPSLSSSSSSSSTSITTACHNPFTLRQQQQPQSQSQASLPILSTAAAAVVPPTTTVTSSTAVVVGPTWLEEWKSRPRTWRTFWHLFEWYDQHQDQDQEGSHHHALTHVEKRWFQEVQLMYGGFTLLCLAIPGIAPAVVPEGVQKRFRLAFVATTLSLFMTTQLLCSAYAFPYHKYLIQVLNLPQSPMLRQKAREIYEHRDTRRCDTRTFCSEVFSHYYSSHTISGLGWPWGSSPASQSQSPTP